MQFLSPPSPSSFPPTKKYFKLISLYFLNISRYSFSLRLPHPFEVPCSSGCRACSLSPAQAELLCSHSKWNWWASEGLGCQSLTPVAEFPQRLKVFCGLLSCKTASIADEMSDGFNQVLGGSFSPSDHYSPRPPWLLTHCGTVSSRCSGEAQNWNTRVEVHTGYVGKLVWCLSAHTKPICSQHC